MILRLMSKSRNGKTDNVGKLTVYLARENIDKDKIMFEKPVPGVNFPNWERVVPQNTDIRGCINIDNSVIDENSRACKSLAEMTGEKVNPKYLADLTKKTWVVRRQREKGKALLLKEHGAKTETYAVIMPLA